VKIFLAGTNSRPYIFDNKEPLYVLESFYYIKEWQIKLIKQCKMFLLDSGAFTFMSSSKKQVNWDKYVEEYAKFINKNNVKYFFELDIDVVVGIKEVERLRKKLEKLTNKKCIPVWHKSRGLKEWKNLTKKYDYVAIGGIVTKEIKKQDYKYFKPLLKIAKENNCKVHGLGFTNIEGMIKYHFDSVDSTNWLSSSRFGNIEYFNGEKMVRYKTPKGKKTVHYKIRDEFVIKEWIKFQKYADKYL
jgi:hypothetical protein